MTTTPCRGCGKPIVFGNTPEGKTIPLDARAPVYRIEVDETTGAVTAVRDLRYHVTHFATCPKASHF